MRYRKITRKIIRTLTKPGRGNRLYYEVKCEGCDRTQIIPAGDLHRTNGCMSCSRAAPRSLVLPGPIPDTTLIPLAGHGNYTLIDNEDLATVRGYKWSLNGHGYVARNTRKGSVLLHRELLELDRNDLRQGDHINGDTLDNRRSNLRIATQLENSRNRKTKRKYKGVYQTASKKWQAVIWSNRKRHCLGTFEHQDDAAKAYDDAATKYFGIFARLNFPTLP